jgi:nucleotide sugar dehydrogenase
MHLREMTLGIIGNGVLGGAMIRGLTEFAKEIRVYDVVREKTTHTLSDTLGSDLVFLCLPTPARARGTCDTSQLEALIDAICTDYHDRRQATPYLVVRSTVSVGFTDRMARKMVEAGLPPRLVHNPEFLTARCAAVDFQTPSRHIIGQPLDGGHLSPPHPIVQETSERLRCLLMERFSGIPTHIMTSDESELVKLTCNSFFALKVMFFNGVKQLCDARELSYDAILQGVLSDGRIAHSHTQVPGPDGQPGFGGTCLPKDLENLGLSMLASNVPIGKLLRLTNQLNRQIRPGAR